MAVTVPPSAELATKSKTKAKSRYLKAKKERKKKRKVDTTHSEPKPKAAQEDAQSQIDDETSSEDTEEQAADATAEEKRPCKRRKTTPDAKDIEMDDGADEPAPETLRRSSTPQAALPSFPLPTLPDAPAKSTLALQGLDKALLDAEIIDPARVVPIDAIDQDRHDSELHILSEKTKKRLGELGITEFFAVQTALLPFLLPPQCSKRALYCPYDPPRDVCASAPTGSGKTLAYVIPVVEILSARIVTRLRALVVLPTRDLVNQVQETFEALSKGRGLKIGVATGQHPFVHEQTQLVGDQNTRLQGGSSKVDILISTPGRLMDHLNGTSNFTLQHLRFLVIDEADRLLAQSFQDWLAQVLAATRPPTHASPSLHFFSSPDLSSSQTQVPSSGLADRDTHARVPYHDALSPSWVHSSITLPDFRTDLDDTKASSCQKLLFSATLTRDPSKIAAIDLRDAKYFVVQGSDNTQMEGLPAMLTEQFTIPSTLKEHMLVCEPSQKPLMLFHLVHAHAVTNAIVFTKSAESAMRLVRLFESFEQAWADEEQTRRRTVVSTYSSDVSRPERKVILEQFKEQKIDILVCSDLVSRGIDISHVSHVVSYDAPVDMRKYVHRVGRTARAGRSGDAWTLVEEQEAHYFKSLMSAANHLEQVKKIRVSEKDIAALVPHYETALSRLKDIYNHSTG